MAHRLLIAGPNMNARKGQRGYSLVEMLVVITIIGILSLVVVPNFVSYYQSLKLKAAMRDTTNSLRSLRSRAASRNEMTKVSFHFGNSMSGDSSTYTAWESTDGKPITDLTKTWTKMLLGANVRAATGSDPTDRKIDTPVDFAKDNVDEIIFNSDGTAYVPGGETEDRVILKTKAKTAVTQYTVFVTSTGKVSSR